MGIRVHHQANVNIHTLLDDVDIGLPQWRVCGRGLNQSVHKGMNDISNVKVHLRTRSGKSKYYIHI